MILDTVTSAADFCSKGSIQNVLYLVGLVYKGIEIVVPIILIVAGMIDLVQALTSQKEDQIKAATSLLIKKLIVAVCVFLVAMIIGLVMNLVGGNDYQECMQCITGWSCSFNPNVID